MTERLNRIESLLLTMAMRQNEMNASLQQTNATLDRTATQQARNTDEVDTLLGAVSTSEIGIRTLVERMTASDRRFEVSRKEAIADRQRSDQRFEESNRRFEAMQENIQRLFLELNNTNRRVENLEQAS